MWRGYTSIIGAFLVVLISNTLLDFETRATKKGAMGEMSE